MSETETAAAATTAAASLDRLKGASVGAVFMLVLQFILGIVYNLYGPAITSKGVGVFSNGWLILHEIMAILLLAVAIRLVLLAFQAKHRVVRLTSSLGLLGVVLAIGAGVSFLNSGAGGASLGMSLAFSLALACYVINLMVLPWSRQSPAS
jgi:hypothetical protein